MKAALLSLLTLSLCLSAQPQSARDRLKSDLQSLRTGAPVTPALTQQVGAHILSMAETTHEPKPGSLQQFSEGFLGALAGRTLSPLQIDALTGDIEQVLQSAGTSTAGFEDTVKDFEKRLQRSGVPAVRSHLVASTLERIGKEVRGPEDFGVDRPSK